MKNKRSYLKMKMEQSHYRLMRCLTIYLHYKKRYDLIWLHYKARLQTGDLEATQAILMAVGELKDKA